jgi:hypothetical protein
MTISSIPINIKGSFSVLSLDSKGLETETVIELWSPIMKWAMKRIRLWILAHIPNLGGYTLYWPTSQTLEGIL